MEITKPNDIFVATIGNPTATTYDLMTLNVTPENSSFFTKEQYKESKFVQDTFKDKDGIQIMKDYMASGSFARGREEKNMYSLDSRYYRCCSGSRSDRVWGIQILHTGLSGRFRRRF